MQPKNVLDLYCGEKDYYAPLPRYTNDKNPDIPADSHEDALKCICRLYYEGRKFDIVDLDPFGSAYDCLNLAIKMARKGLVVTFGELGHKRWKRLDFVRSHYGIDDLEDFHIGKMIQEVKRIGRMNRKELVLFDSTEYDRTGRAWFIIEEIKVTEQWEKEK